MTDASFIPNVSGADIQIFTAQNSGTAATGVAVWTKPRNATMMFVYCLGSGAGGGGGFTRAAGSAGGGGGGGGAGANSRIFIPAFFVPDVLYVTVALGGAGSTGSTVLGSAGALSYVSFLMGSSMNVDYNMLTVSGAAAAAQSGAGSAAAAGIAGAGGTVATNAVGFSYGNFLAVAGQQGSNGGAQTGAAGTAVNWGSGGFTSGGSGGAGNRASNFAGGAITGSGLTPSLAGGASGGGAGLHGFVLWNGIQIVSMGGTGGGTANAAVGGKGGDGGLGSGGGGGAAGTTGGAGGRGGDGIVYIISY